MHRLLPPCLLPRLLRALAWGAAVATALTLLAQGLGAGIYLENTDTALARAREGERLVLLACAVLVSLIGWSLSRGWPRWVAVGLALPVVLCGGFTLVAPESLLPQLSVVLAYPAAIAAGIAGLLTAGTARPR